MNIKNEHERWKVFAKVNPIINKAPGLYPAVKKLKAAIKKLDNLILLAESKRYIH